MGDEVTQIRIGGHMTGIIGLKAALAEAQPRCRGLADAQIGKILLDILARRNYLSPNVQDEYAGAFVREYKKHIGASVGAEHNGGIQIKVLGMGCPQCDRLEQELMNAMAETGVAADLEHVRDPAQIVRYGVMGSPALLIDGKVKAVGSIPPRAKIKAWLQEAEAQTKKS